MKPASCVISHTLMKIIQYFCTITIINLQPFRANTSLCKLRRAHSLLKINKWLCGPRKCGKKRFVKRLPCLCSRSCTLKMITMWPDLLIKEIQIPMQECEAGIVFLTTAATWKAVECFEALFLMWPLQCSLFRSTLQHFYQCSWVTSHWLSSRARLVSHISWTGGMHSLTYDHVYFW